MKTLKNILFLTLPSVIILLLVLEVFFRTVIPASEIPFSEFNEEERIYSFNRDRPEGMVTTGKFAQIRSRWRINNYSWNYATDYKPVKEGKLVAVIGDSYVEAFQVNVDENFPFLLGEKLKNDNYEVYAFGKSGAPLSHYLHLSRYVNRHFDPDILIFNLVANDYAESVHELYPAKFHFMQLSLSSPDSITENQPGNNPEFKKHKTLKSILYKSALVRYMLFNLRLTELWKTPPNKTYEGNIDPAIAKKQNEQIRRATEYAVRTIRAENSDKRIIFVMDAPREAIYNNALEKSETIWLNEMMKTICAENGAEFIDLTGSMNEDYGRNKTKFNSDIDSHWDRYGHRFVAGQLYEHLKKEIK
jgi:lysophospholipase L1-like esterase